MRFSQDDALISIEEARSLYQNGRGAHDFDHVLRVLRLAEHIGRREGADMIILRTACLLHDVARAEQSRTGICHAQRGAERAREILAGHPPAVVDAIAHAIAAHRFRGDVQPQTLEAMILSDADKLDAIGAIGVARAFAFAGEQGQPLWTPLGAARVGDHGAHTPVHEYLEKLSHLRERMFTRTAKALAEERHAFMERFFVELDEEVRGKH